jgi:hypothetical protein
LLGERHKLQGVKGQQTRDRIVLNEALFRDVNAAAADMGSGCDIDAICECGDLDCAEPVRLTADEYASVRSEATQFAVAPGHEDPEVEDVVAKTERFYTVRKKVGEEYLAGRTGPTHD